MIAFLRTVPGWLWFLALSIVTIVVEDCRHQACEERGGAVVQRNIIDGCREGARK